MPSSCQVSFGDNDEQEKKTVVRGSPAAQSHGIVRTLSIVTGPYEFINS